MNLYNKSQATIFKCRTISIIVFIIISINANSQKLWFFGNQSALDFTTSAPAAFTGFTPQHTAGASTAVAYDNNNNLVFYTDGKNIWDWNNNLNSFVLPGPQSNDGSGKHPVVVVPKPCTCDTFFIFTGWGGTISASMVVKNGGSLIVPQGSQQLFVTPNPNIFKNLTATYALSQKKYWIATSGHDNLPNPANSVFYTFSIGCDTKNLSQIAAPVQSSIPLNYAYPYSTGLMDLKFSGSGNKLAFICGNMPGPTVGVLDFDKNTGVLSISSSTSGINYRTSNDIIQQNIFIDGVNIKGSPVYCHSIEFSPNENYVYFTGASNASNGPLQLSAPNLLFQYQISNPAWMNNAPIFINNFSICNSQDSRGWNDILLAANGKIYIEKDNCTSMAVINNPNGLGASCGFILNAPLPPFSPTPPNTTLPNIVKNYQADICQPLCAGIIFSNIMGTCQGIVAGSTTPAYSLVPQFTNNSGYTISSFTVSTTQATIVSGSTQGPFGTGANTGTAIIFSNPAPMPVFFNFTFTFSNNSQCVVQVAIDYPNCPSCSCATWPATLSYTISSGRGTPPSTSTVANNGVIILNPNRLLTLNEVTAPCVGSSCEQSLSYELYGLNNNPIISGTNYTMMGPVIRNLPCSNSGVYKLVVKARCGTNNCSTPFTIFISKPCYSPPISVCGTAICNSRNVNNNSINISVNGGTPPFTYLWSNGITSQNLTGVIPGNYTVTVTDAYGYTATASFSITCPNQCNFLQVPNSINTISAGQSATIGIAPEPGITYSWFSNPVGFTSTQSSVTVTPAVTTTYTLIRRNNNPSCPPKISTATITVN